MPSGLGPTFATQPFYLATAFTSADTTVAKQILGQATGPFIVEAINVASDDTAAQVLDIFVRTSATNSLLCSVSIPAGSGKNGVVTVDALANLPTDVRAALNFTVSQTLQAALEATMTAAKTITVQVLAGSY